MAGRKKAPPPRKARVGPGTLLVILVVLAALRSAWATRLDGFTIDEPYHVVAGAAYARLGDYRLNPEHPPLVKLWLGATIPARALPLPPFRPLFDKPDERAFAEGALFTGGDFPAVRTRVRTAMIVLNGALLLLFALALRREAGEKPALSALLFLVIDPTVAAHMPVAMTDLPVALLAALAVLAGVRAVRTAARSDVLLAALALGGALGTKHSALVAAAAVLGLAAYEVARRRPEGPSRWRRARPRAWWSSAPGSSSGGSTASGSASTRGRATRSTGLSRRSSKTSGARWSATASASRSACTSSRAPTSGAWPT